MGQEVVYQVHVQPRRNELNGMVVGELEAGSPKVGGRGRQEVG
jgi:hypothetical protein